MKNTKTSKMLVDDFFNELINSVYKTMGNEITEEDSEFLKSLGVDADRMRIEKILGL